jgi:hypothetical protein
MRSLLIEKEDLIIPYPEKYSEFEIHATLYFKLKTHFESHHYCHSVRGEVRKKGHMGSRFDLVIFKNRQAVCIIEVKDTRPKKINTETRQFRKYSSFNLPLIYCYTMDDIDLVMDRVENEII